MSSAKPGDRSERRGTWVRTPLVLFLAASVAIGTVLAAGMTMRSSVRESEDIVQTRVLTLSDVERLRALRERVSRKVRSFLLLGDDRFLAEVKSSERAFNALLFDLRQRARSPKERQLIDHLTARERARRQVTARLIARQKALVMDAPTARILETELQPIVDAMDGTVQDLVAWHQSDVERARIAATGTFENAALVLGLAAGLALLVAALTSFALGKTLRRLEGRAARLERERNRFFDMSIDLVCIAGTDGYFKQLNPAFEAVLGYTRAELLGRPIVEFVHVDDRQKTGDELGRLGQGETTADFENRYVCKDGHFKWLSWRATPEPSGAIYAVARDISEQKASQERLAALNEELRVMAVIDELTGLHNRRGFNLLAEQHLKNVQRTRQKAVFFFADLD
ncbi:MAG TPA: PAS domain S-box protein, partial [Polyangiaceae bacterium]|nr:PAS domain S-box protein [Polyangiaceae bacterium]